MFGIFVRACSAATLSLLFITIVSAQEDDQERQLNQAIFNKIEYHFNLQETDSIYNLAGERFQQSLSRQAFQTVMSQQLYPLGRIQTAELKSFDQRTGIYKLTFVTTPLQLVLSLDSANYIETLAFQPYAGDPVQEGNLPVIAPKTDKLERFVDSLALAYTRKSQTHALAIGIIDAGKTSTFYYGETEKGNRRLPDERTLFEIASITKTFTATLLAYDVQTGLVNLDDPITKYLPDSLAENPDLARITLQQLANHTSGLPRLPSNMQETAAAHPQDPYKGYTKAHLYSFLKNYRASIAPDSIYEYSNLGFGLLGDILSTVGRQPYGELVKTLICQPLGLTNTTETPSPDSQYIAKVYTNKGQETTVWSFDDFAAHGSLKSTITDLLSYAKAHFKAPESDLEHALALTRQFTYFNPPDTDIGLAWHMNMIDGELVYWHNGGTAGSCSYLALTPDKRIAVVVLSNTAESVDSIGRTIIERIL